MILPQDKKLETERLLRIFDNTSASYKFYWFLSILYFVKEEKDVISFDELAYCMISEAWTIANNPAVSFGKVDSMKEQAAEIRNSFGISEWAKKKEVFDTIYLYKNNSKIKQLVKILCNDVPYRFLSTWIPYTSNKDVILQSQAFTNDCLYSIEDNKIVINHLWTKYITDNNEELRDFAYFHLSEFLKRRNSSVSTINHISKY